jgi:FKBP-type peptidyl-prolyl cis-trans isomerase FkpA
MAEVTRVPIKPISKGSLLMLFLGIAIGLAIAGAFAFITRPKGVDVEVVREGTGAHPKADDVVFVNYVGKLKDGKVFDKSQDPQLPPQLKAMLPAGTPLPLAQMVPGFREAAVQMQKGGKYEVFIPADKAYGAEGRMNPQTNEGVPPNSDISFEVELVDFMSMAEAQQRFMAMQQLMQQTQGKQGAPGGAPAPQPAQ